MTLIRLLSLACVVKEGEVILSYFITNFSTREKSVVRGRFNLARSFCRWKLSDRGIDPKIGKRSH